MKCCFSCILAILQVLYYAIFLYPVLNQQHGLVITVYITFMLLFVHILYRPTSRYLMRFYHVPFFTAARPRPLGVVLEGGGK